MPHQQTFRPFRGESSEGSKPGARSANEAEKTSAEIDAVLRKIQNLFALSQGNANEHEATAAMETARRMMQKYGLSDEVLKTIQRGEASQEVGREWVEYFNTEITWKTDLIYLIATFNNCEAYYSQRYKMENGKKKPYGNMYIMGRPLKRRFCINLYKYLVDVLWRLSYQESEKYKARMVKIGQKPRVRQFSDSYRKGAVTRLGLRLKEIHDREMKEGMAADEHGPAVTALVLVTESERDRVAIDKYKDDVKLNLKTDAAQRHIGDANAYRKGFDDAGDISLAPQIEKKEGGVDEFGQPTKTWK